MYDIPIITIELDSVKASIKHMFQDRNNELNKMIENTIDERLSLEWIQAEINKSVDSCIKEAIKGLSSNYQIKNAIEEGMSAEIAKLVNGRGD